MPPSRNERPEDDDPDEEGGRSAPSAIEIRELRVRRGGKLILPGIDLRVRAGTVTGLLGPSGSGKTTLMRAIVGVQSLERGTVTVLGEAAGSESLRHTVAYLTQDPSVYGDLTVSENLRYFARVLRAPGSRITEVIELVGLGEQADQVAGTLSGGEFSRASLAVALLGRPQLLVLDEPTVDVDPILRRELWRSFYRLADDGATLLVSSHVMDEAERCQELVLMRGGEVIATGTPRALRERTHAQSLEDAFISLAHAGSAGTDRR